MEKKNNSLIATIENEFVMKAHYSLSAVEQKLILYLASRINPLEDKEFHKQIVAIKDLEAIFLGADADTKKWGSVYSYMESVCDNLLSQTIRFVEPIVLNEKTKVIKGGINWFQHILIIENEKKETSIEFKFSDMMKPFLLELNKYVKLNAFEVMSLRGKYSIRMYQIFKAERERTKKYKVESILEYDLIELRSLLGIGDKYTLMANLRRRVLEPIAKEINDYSKEISVKFDYIKKRNNVTGVRFMITDKSSKVKEIKEVKLNDFTPSDKDIASLTNAQYKAYMELIEYGVKEGIAFKQIIPTIKVGVITGFEDVFVKQAITYFNGKTTQKTKSAKAGAFVNWWVESKVFSDKADLYWKFHDYAYEHQKGLSPEAKANRELAKNITREEFSKLIANKK